MSTPQYWLTLSDRTVHPNEEEMLAKLLQEGILFCNSRKYLDSDDKTVRPETIVLFVNCSDVFAWGCADAESIALAELPELFKMYEANPKTAATIWVCKKRNEKPQLPVADWLKEENAWTDEMEQLPSNQYDSYCKEQYEKKIQEKQLQ